MLSVYISILSLSPENAGPHSFIEFIISPSTPLLSEITHLNAPMYTLPSKS